jgi:ubiquinone biosynthesis protein COQ4
MPLKYEPATSAVASLLRDPFDNIAAGQLVDAIADTWLMRVARQHMIRGLSQQELAHLRELTYQPLEHTALRALPSTSLGHEYAAHLERHELNPRVLMDVFPALEATASTDWVLHRYLKLHDLLHFLLDFGIDAPGEMGLQIFNLRNFGEPHGLLALASLPLSIARRGYPRQMLREARQGWRLGARLPNLLHAPLEEMLELSTHEVRRRLGLPGHERGNERSATG